MGPTCLECRFFTVIECIGGYPAVSKAVMGKCQFNPPTVVVDTTGVRTAWPIVPSDGFCRHVLDGENRRS